MKRNKFSLSHYNLVTCDMGELVPIGWMEVLPGDTFQHSTSLLLRVSPLVAPVMHPVHVRIHHWYVPNRLLWDDWEKFITGGPDGLDASVPPTVYLAEAQRGTGSLADYLGGPQQAAQGYSMSALPFRAYAHIFNEWYRDQDLVQELPIAKTGGQDTSTNIALMQAAWEKDYFTSARPFTQKGPVVSIPLTGDAPVRGIYAANQTYAPGGPAYGTPGVTNPSFSSNGGLNPFLEEDPAHPGFPGIYADLSAVTSATINDLRRALALQRYEEARARYGSRYTEYLRYLGVRSSDARLQRPEYLGGGKQTIQFSEVLQTGPDDSENGQIVGQLKGHGLAAVRSNRYRRFFEEHGIVMSLLTVRPRTMYHQGLRRAHLRRVKEDYWQRELEHIGQQEIQVQELWTNGPDAEHTEVFGYQDRYDEYRRMESTVSGEFKYLLNYWHMAREFSAKPVLNASFVQSNPTKRINAVQTNDVLWIMAAHNVRARRMLSKRGNSHIY